MKNTNPGSLGHWLSSNAHKWLSFVARSQRSFLELPHGIPSHDTFNRVFALLNPTAFQEGFLNWVRAIAQNTLGRLVAIDGKTARHSFDKAAGKGALHLVSAWASENRLLLGQQAVESKSNDSSS